MRRKNPQASMTPPKHIATTISQMVLSIPTIPFPSSVLQLQGDLPDSGTVWSISIDFLRLMYSSNVNSASPVAARALSSKVACRSASQLSGVGRNRVVGVSAIEFTAPHMRVFKHNRRLPGRTSLTTLG